MDGRTISAHDDRLPQASTDIDGTAEISLDAYRDRINPLHDSMGHMGRTNYHVAMQAVIDHHAACGAEDPAFVVFQTDGSPTSKTAAEHVLCTAARAAGTVTT